MTHILKLLTYSAAQRRMFTSPRTDFRVLFHFSHERFVSVLLHQEFCVEMKAVGIVGTRVHGRFPLTLWVIIHSSHSQYYTQLHWHLLLEANIARNIVYVAAAAAVAATDKLAAAAAADTDGDAAVLRQWLVEQCWTWTSRIRTASSRWWVERLSRSVAGGVVLGVTVKVLSVERSVSRRPQVAHVSRSTGDEADVCRTAEVSSWCCCYRSWSADRQVALTMRRCPGTLIIRRLQPLQPPSPWTTSSVWDGQREQQWQWGRWRVVLSRHQWLASMTLCWCHENLRQNQPLRHLHDMRTSRAFTSHQYAEFHSSNFHL